MSVCLDQVIWLVVKKSSSIKLGDMIYKLLQTSRAMIETRSEICFQRQKTPNKSQIFHHSGILITWLLKAKELCASQGSQTLSEDTLELPFIQLVNN